LSVDKAVERAVTDGWMITVLRPRYRLASAIRRALAVAIPCGYLSDEIRGAGWYVGGKEAVR
jgi:hypothetical protein